MFAALSILIVRLITFFYGKFASHFFPRPTFQDQEIGTYFFQSGSNFRATMARVRSIQVAIFGTTRLAAFLKLNLIHYLLFASAFIIFMLVIPGFEEVFSFVRRGFALDVDTNERIYAIQNNYIVTQKGVYVGDAVSRISIMTLIFMVTISASGSIALLYNFGMTKTFANRNFGLIATNMRLGLAFLVSIACDLGAVAVLLFAIVLAGKVGGPHLEEYFKASFPAHYFGYGVSIEIGSPTQGTSSWGYGLTQTDVFFGQYSELTKKVEKPVWPGLIFDADGPVWMDDAGKICDQFAIDRDECADRMRAMFLRHLDVRVEWIPHMARAVAAYVGQLACGRNLWSGIPTGIGASEALKLALPSFASLAALLLARALMVPWLIILSFADRALVAFGRKTALQSEEGYREISTHGAVLLSLPPVLAAIALFTAFVRAFC